MAFLLITGSEPGRPRHTGQTAVFGSAPKTTGLPQNIFVVVPSATCVSIAITGSYRLTASSNGTGLVAVGIVALPFVVTAAWVTGLSPRPEGRPDHGHRPAAGDHGAGRAPPRRRHRLDRAGRHRARAP